MIITACKIICLDVLQRGFRHATTFLGPNSKASVKEAYNYLGVVEFHSCRNDFFRRR